MQMSRNIAGVLRSSNHGFAAMNANSPAHLTFLTQAMENRRVFVLNKMHVWNLKCGLYDKMIAT